MAQADQELYLNTDSRLRSLPANALRLLLMLSSAAAPIVAYPAGERESDLPFTPAPDASPAQAGPAQADTAQPVLPDPMPDLRPFEDMQAFTAGPGSPNKFALDPSSIRIQPPFVLAIVASRSPAGAMTTGYQAFDCRTRQYRLLALPDRRQGWQPASERAPWRDFMNGDRRNQLYRTVGAAFCQQGERPADNVTDMLRVLREGRTAVGP